MKMKANLKNLVFLCSLHLTMFKALNVLEILVNFMQLKYDTQEVVQNLFAVKDKDLRGCCYFFF